MGAADTANLIAALNLKDAFSGPLKKADSALGKFDAHLDNTQGRAYKAGQQIGTGIKRGAEIAAVGFGLLTTQVFAGLNQLSELEEVNAATVAGLTSTKNAAGLTAGEIRHMAEEAENLNATFDDKLIQSGENVLLTFTNIRKEAFEPALTAALDLSVAMKQDLQSSIVQIGKALNDPAKGFTALRRVGIQFTADQEKQIKTLQKSGDLLGAQRIILKELGTEFGGRFAAQGKTAAGTIAGIGDAIEDLQKATAQSLFPTIQKVLPKLREFLTSPAFIKGAEDIGKAIGDIFSEDNIAKGADALSDLFSLAKEAAPVIQSAASVTGDVIKTAVGLFRSLPPEIQALAVAGLAINKLTDGLVTNIAGGLISAVLSGFKGVMAVNAGVVNVTGAVAGGPGNLIPPAAGAGGGALGFLTSGIVGPAAVIAASIAATVIGSADVRSKIDTAITTGDTTSLRAAAEAARKHGVSDENNAALKALQEIAHNTGSTKPGASGDRSQDGSEKALQAARTAFTSIPTRAEIRTQQAQLKEKLKTTSGDNAKVIRNQLKTLQNRLDTRIANAAAKAAEDAAATRRAFTAAIATGLVQRASDIINVTVPVTSVVNGRVLDANINRYSSTFVNGQRPRVGGA